MTSEVKTIIQLSDIKAIGFECAHCRATYYVPIDKLDRDLPRKCQNCLEPFFNDTPVQSAGHSEQRVLGAFIEFFKTLRNQSFAAAIRLEIAQPRKDAQ